MKKVTSAQDVLQAVTHNQIWLNAISCVNPSPKFCEDLGREILEMLAGSRVMPKHNLNNDKETEHIQEVLNDFARLTPTLYLSINKS